MTRSFEGVSANDVLERLAGLEGRDLGSGDLDLGAGGGVAADALGAGLDLKRAKADELNLLTSGERALDGGENGVGVMGLVLIGCKMASPVMKIMAITLTMKLTAALMQPFEEKRLAGCLQDLSQVTTLLYIAVLSVGVMMFISVTLMIRAGTLNMGG